MKIKPGLGFTRGVSGFGLIAWSLPTFDSKLFKLSRGGVPGYDPSLDLGDRGGVLSRLAP